MKIFIGIVVACALFAFFSSYSWVKPSQDWRVGQRLRITDTDCYGTLTKKENNSGQAEWDNNCAVFMKQQPVEQAMPWDDLPILFKGWVNEK